MRYNFPTIFIYVVKHSLALEATNRLKNNSKENGLTQTVIQVSKERKPQTVEELVGLVKEKLQVSEKEVLESILTLQSQGKIRLLNQLPQALPNLTIFLKTEQALWYWATITLAIIATAVVFAIPEEYYPWIHLRYVLSTIFILWLPGYTFMKALFPKQVPIKTPTKHLDLIERIVLSLGMSLAIVLVLGLLLNYILGGILLAPLTLSLCALTASLATIAVVREHNANT